MQGRPHFGAGDIGRPPTAPPRVNAGGAVRADEHHGSFLAGPRATPLISRASHEAWTSEAMPWQGCEGYADRGASGRSEGPCRSTPSTPRASVPAQRRGPSTPTPRTPRCSTPRDRAPGCSTPRSRCASTPRGGVGGGGALGTPRCALQMTPHGTLQQALAERHLHEEAERQEVTECMEALYKHRKETLRFLRRCEDTRELSALQAVLDPQPKRVDGSRPAPPRRPRRPASWAGTARQQCCAGIEDRAAWGRV